MFYLLYEYAQSQHQHWPLINLMHYETVRVFLSLILSLIHI